MKKRSFQKIKVFILASLTRKSAHDNKENKCKALNLKENTFRVNVCLVGAEAKHQLEA